MPEKQNLLAFTGNVTMSCGSTVLWAGEFMDLAPLKAGVVL